jgi:hypothetical protein
MQETKTIIVGGGIAGMSCAMKLLEAGEDFLLVTDDLGGRIKYSVEAKVNFGAYFVMASYVNAKRLVSQGQWINPLDSCFHSSTDEIFKAISWHTISQLSGLLRFYFALREFSSHYEPFKQRCLTTLQKEALKADPYLEKIFSMPASQFAKEKNIERVVADYVSKFAYACTGASLEQITALDFLNVSMGMITPIHCLIFEPETVAQRLGKHLVRESVVSVEKGSGGHIISGESGQAYRAENVVIATPADVTQKLLGLEEIRKASSIYVFHIKAELKPIYRGSSMNLFPSNSEFMLTVKQHDGSYLVYSREKNTDLNQICERFELLATMDWEKAMYVQGKAFMEQQYGDGIYVAGDHNGLGLEPAAIFGIFAANQIIKKVNL